VPDQFRQQLIKGQTPVRRLLTFPTINILRGTKRPPSHVHEQSLWFSLCNALDGSIDRWRTVCARGSVPHTKLDWVYWGSRARDLLNETWSSDL